MDKQPSQERKLIHTESLRDLAIYLEGIKAGKGDLQPLGTIVLEDLWNTVAYLRGDARFVAEKDMKPNKPSPLLP